MAALGALEELSKLRMGYGRILAATFVMNGNLLLSNKGLRKKVVRNFFLKNG